MEYVLIIHEVKDYAEWKRGFDSAAALRREAGELEYQVLQYGLAATRMIRTLGVNNSAQVPIIASTARDPATELAHWQAAGITDYVHKPFSEDELWAVINTYI